jgi:hypothetical protein
MDWFSFLPFYISFCDSILCLSGVYGCWGLEWFRADPHVYGTALKPSLSGPFPAASHPGYDSLCAASAPPHLLSLPMQVCGALSERALLAVSELEPKRVQQQLYRELESGTAREVQDNGQVLLEAVG